MGLIDISLTIQLVIELSSICIAFWALEAIDFDKFINKKQIIKKQTLILLLSLGLGHLVSQLVFSITNIITAMLNSI